MVRFGEDVAWHGEVVRMCILTVKFWKELKLNTVRTKDQAISYLDNSLYEIRSYKMTAKGKSFIAETKYLAELLGYGSDLSRSERIQGMKMQELREAIREADELILMIQA